MNKYCYVCGKEIKAGSFYYCIGKNSYVCNSDKCYNFYFWDNLATHLIFDKQHEYAIINKKVYQIGSEKDEPKGFSGKFWIVQFNDGTCVETNSLWYKGELPIRLQHDFPDNAIFINKEG